MHLQVSKSTIHRFPNYDLATIEVIADGEALTISSQLSHALSDMMGQERIFNQLRTQIMAEVERRLFNDFNLRSQCNPSVLH